MEKSSYFKIADMERLSPEATESTDTSVWKHFLTCGECAGTRSSST
jgi:hypothetical protein